MSIFSPVHIVFFAVIALVVLGPRRFPEFTRALGHGVREFRDVLNGEVSPKRRVGEGEEVTAGCDASVGEAAAAGGAAPVGEAATRGEAATTGDATATGAATAAGAEVSAGSAVATSTSDAQ